MENNWAERGLLHLYASPLGTPWREVDERAYADYMYRLMELAGEPHYAIADRLRTIEKEMRRAALVRPTANHLAHIAVRALQMEAYQEAMFHLMRMGLLVEKRFMESGRCPETLEPWRISS